MQVISVVRLWYHLIHIKDNIKRKEKKMDGTVAVLIPQKGLIVRDPRSQSPLLEKGEIKPMIGPEGRYWRRRLRDGSVTKQLPKSVPKQRSRVSERKKEE